MSTIDVVCLGSMILDFFPGEEEKDLTQVKIFNPAPGGAAANVAVALQNFGKNAAFVGKVGKDRFGERLIKAVAEYNVNTSAVSYDNETHTTLNFHAKYNGQVEYLFYPGIGADRKLKKEELPASMIQNAKILHVDSLVLISDEIKETTIEAIKIAKSANTLVSLDVNYRTPLWSKEQAVTTLKTVLPHVDIVKMNDDELQMFTGKKDVNAAKSILDYGVKICLITQGSEGSFLISEKVNVSQKPFNVNSIDSIGCGDAFMAGFLAQALQHNDVFSLSGEQYLTILKFANASGAITSTKHGAIPALPQLKEIEQLIN